MSINWTRDICSVSKLPSKLTKPYELRFHLGWQWNRFKTKQKMQTTVLTSSCLAYLSCAKLAAFTISFMAAYTFFSDTSHIVSPGLFLAPPSHCIKIKCVDYKMTSFGETSDEDFIKMTTSLFQQKWCKRPLTSPSPRKYGLGPWSRLGSNPDSG